jgi:hypothetical protein
MCAALSCSWHFAEHGRQKAGRASLGSSVISTMSKISTAHPSFKVRRFHMLGLNKMA